MRPLSMPVAALLAATLSVLAPAPSARAQPPVHASAHPRELILAGGALRLCSSLSRRECRDGTVFDGSAFDGSAFDVAARAPARHALDDAGIARSLDPRLWRGREDVRAAMAATLRATQATLGAAALERGALLDALEVACVDADAARACRDGERAAWLRLDDDDRGAVLAALEVPQLAAGTRRTERASLDASRSPHGPAVLRAFVAAARERAGGAAPRVAVVTASAYDPFDPVDFYLDALRQAGAQAQWWPVDAALAAATFEMRDCAALPALRIERLQLPARERVYPDLVARQQRACEQPALTASLPERVHGVFFAGGDQWKLRRAFVGTDERPNDWLRTLRAAVARGDVVIGGTSAGSAVQAGAAMLSNGTPASALAHGAVAAEPPRPGCARSGDCVDGLDEDAFTYWPAGGLALAPGWTVDTHFSERAREPRLLRLLAQTGTRYGIGVDETSALRLRWRSDDDVEIDAIGASGGWVFDVAPGCRSDGLEGRASYVAPGAMLRVGDDGASTLTLAADTVVPDGANAIEGAFASADAAGAPADALADGAIRAAAQRLAAGLPRAELRAGIGGPTVTLEPTATTRAWRNTEAALAGIGDLRLRIAPLAGCAP